MEPSQSEKEYLLTLLTEKKRTEAQLRNLEDEKRKWSDRLNLAKQHQRDDLIQAADQRLAEIELEMPSLRSTIAMRNREIEEQRARLQDAYMDEGRNMTRAQTDAFLHQLEVAAGLKSDDPLDFSKQEAAESKNTADELDSLEAELELDKLKKSIGSSGEGPNQ